MKIIFFEFGFIVGCLFTVWCNPQWPCPETSKELSSPKKTISSPKENNYGNHKTRAVLQGSYDQAIWFTIDTIYIPCQ